MAIMMVAPDPLYSLRDQVFPKFQAAFELEQRHGKSREDIKELSVFVLLDVMFPKESTEIRSLPAYQAMRDSSLPMYGAIEELVTWSKQFNLTGTPTRIRQEATIPTRLDAVWPLVAALETILPWHFVHGRVIETPGGVPLFRFRKPALPQPAENLAPIQLRTVVYDCRANIPKEISDSLGPDGPPIVDAKEVDTPGWCVEWEPESVFRERALKDFREWLNRYIAARKLSIESAGLVKAPGKRELLHFLWAVNYQVNGDSAAVIAEQHKAVTKYAVEKAVQGVLDMIRLEARDPRPGRWKTHRPVPVLNRPYALRATLLRFLVDSAGNS